MGGNPVDLEEQHRVFCSLPPLEDFKDGRYFKMIFDFLVNYVVKLYGISRIRSTLESSPGCGPIDLVTTSDFAYVVAIIENKKKVWEQQARMKGMSDEEKKGYKDSSDYKGEEPTFTSRRGKKYEYLGSGWTKEGKVFYNKVWREWKKMFKKEELWEMLEVAWDMYESDNEVVKMWQKKVSFLLHE